MIVSPLLSAAESCTTVVYDPNVSSDGVAIAIEANAGVKSFGAPRSKARISPETRETAGRLE